MRIEVSGKHLDVTPAIRDYADQKCAKIPRYFDGVQEIFVVLENPRAEEFSVEIRVDVVKHKDFIAKQDGQNLYECIDLAVDKVTRQLKDFKERLRDH